MYMNKRVVMAFTAVAALGTALPAGAQTSATTQQQQSKTGVVNASHDYSKSMDNLLQAAQRLRETIQALAGAPAGEQRNAAMESARKALLDAQQAMIDLPPELRSTGATMSEADYRNAMDKLKQAAQRLRESAQAMATQPAGERRNEAIGKVNEAIIEANQAMVQLPWEPGLSRTQTGATSGVSSAGKTVSGTGATGFDTLDRNRDGVISRDEFSQQR